MPKKQEEDLRKVSKSMASKIPPQLVKEGVKQTLIQNQGE